METRLPRIAAFMMNPALDVSTSTPRVRPTDKLRCTKPGFEPGGGGINVARVVHELGGKVAAIFPPGGRRARRSSACSRKPAFSSSRSIDIPDADTGRLVTLDGGVEHLELSLQRQSDARP